ncbi:DUF1405 domain-containing protein [Heliophilum fasciatum]|nr:DUF1405 domain-containing protein [Heliophilum fasciatum]MCW2278659.1 putative membrane protein YpjA [Heliophilum fasciatum]
MAPFLVSGLQKQTERLRRWLERDQIILLLILINFVGTLYGFWWYKEQLADTPWYLWLLVPDSPLASLDFTIILVLRLMGTHSSWLNCLAPAVLIKYGLWAVILNIHGAYLAGGPSIVNWMLGLSHLGMAVQALLFWPRFAFSTITWKWVSLWIVFNDAADYGLNIYPTLFDFRQYHWAWISAVVLSVLVILLAYQQLRQRPVRQPGFRVRRYIPVETGHLE